MSIVRGSGVLLLVALATTACREKPASGSMPHGTAMTMMPGFQARLDSLAANPGMMHGSMSSYPAEVKAMVGAMHADMMAAGMHSDVAYEALADSVVRSSAALGSASGPDFGRLVAQHVDQVRRLAAAYQHKAATM